MIGTLAAVRQRKKMNAVVMHAGLQRLFVCAVTGVGFERGRAGNMTDGIAPSIKRHGGVALRNAHTVIGGNGNAAKTERAVALESGSRCATGNALTAANAAEFFSSA